LLFLFGKEGLKEGRKKEQEEKRKKKKEEKMMIERRKKNKDGGSVSNGVGGLDQNILRL